MYIHTYIHKLMAEAAIKGANLQPIFFFGIYSSHRKGGRGKGVLLAAIWNSATRSHSFLHTGTLIYQLTRLFLTCAFNWVKLL